VRAHLLPLALLLACGPTVDDGTGISDATDGTDATDDSDDPGPPPDLSVAGPATVTTDTGSTPVRDDCTLAWTRYAPDDERARVLVVLAHGFARSQEQMAGWAEHQASWGVEVVTPDLCYAGPFSVDHPANGRAVADLARELADDRPVIVAGHSAGGLAAWLAAADLGSEAAGVLLLDPVDNGELGTDARAGVTAPSAALFAEPGSCNAQGNGVAMVAEDTRSLRVDGADHCDFEAPTDGICTALCGASSDGDEGIRTTLLALTTAFAHWHGGVDPRAEGWWTEGSELRQGLPADLSAP